MIPGHGHRKETTALLIADFSIFPIGGIDIHADRSQSAHDNINSFGREMKLFPCTHIPVF